MNERLEIITCSYGPDLERARHLCASVDKYVDPSIRHTLIVPAKDRDQFRPLENRRRDVQVVQDVVPGNFRALPPGRQAWVHKWGLPIRGWIMQQITKLSANRATDAELIMFADSDLRFVRPLQMEDVYRDGRLRLHRIPGAKAEGRHLKWHQRTRELLGLPAASGSDAYLGSDYVGQLITWRRDHLEGLQRQIQVVTEEPWYKPVARSLHMSEYILYGSYVEHIAGAAGQDHFYTSRDLCHCCWFQEDAERLSAGTQGVDASALAVLVQSNLGLAPAQEDAVFDAAVRQLQPLAAGA